MVLGKANVRVSLEGLGGGSFLFFCNHNVKGLSIYSQFYSEFYSELFQCWSEFNDGFDTRKKYQSAYSVEKRRYL